MMLVIIVSELETSDLGAETRSDAVERCRFQSILVFYQVKFEASKDFVGIQIRRFRICALAPSCNLDPVLHRAR
jgi:hypothetical protein